MQHPGGVLLPPVQTLVATSIFAKGENVYRIPHPPLLNRSKGRAPVRTLVQKSVRWTLFQPAGESIGHRRQSVGLLAMTYHLVASDEGFEPMKSASTP